MKGSIPALAAATIAGRQAGNIDYNAAPPNLSTLGNNSLFDTWRPRAHVLPPRYHIGDPCMHYTDPKTGLFHVGYLFTSNETGGAAGATTDDLVTYRDTNPDDTFMIVSGGKNDPVAVFDGSVIPSGINETATMFYTSVSYLPIHWTLPYIKGSETKSLAVSYDGGANFTKLGQGPSIPGAPQGSVAMNVTGFRDPFVFQSPQMDHLLESEDGVWYAVISGGEHDVDAAAFLYRQYDAEFRDWEYLGKWWSEPPNSTWGDGTWAGRWGFNFEVVNAIFLNENGYDEEEGETFLTTGAEWSYAPIELQVSDKRSMLWAAGNTTLDKQGKADFNPTMAGFVDWGMSAYAAAGKPIPATSVASQSSNAPDRFISYNWLTNDFFGTNDFPVDQQGWDGALTTAREFFRGIISNVVDNELVHGVASWRVCGSNDDGTVELATLGQSIVREALSAFKENATNTISEPKRTISGSEKDLKFSSSPESKHFLLATNITFPKTARGNDSDVKAGFKILTSEYESTSIYYQFSNESLIVDRSNSSAAAATTDGIESYNEAGKLRLFDIRGADGETQVETLDLKIVVDNAIVEVYINDRFALSTWVWSWYASSTGIEYLHKGSSNVEFGDVTVYEGLVDAWPERSRPAL